MVRLIKVSCAMITALHLWGTETRYAFSAENGSDDEYAMVHFNNVSSYPLAVKITGFVDAQGVTKNEHYKTQKYALKVSDEQNIRLPKDSYWKIEFSAERDEVAKVANKEFIADIFVNCSKGTVLAINGLHNYDCSREAKTRYIEERAGIWGAFWGNANVPKNDNPLLGAMDTIDGAGLLVKGALSISSLARHTVVTQLLDPNIYNNQNNVVGIRFEIEDTKSYWFAGIEVKRSRVLANPSKRTIMRVKFDNY